MSRSRIPAAALVLLAACAETVAEPVAPSVAPPVVPPPAPSAAKVVAPPEKVLAPCDTFGREQRAALREYFDEQRWAQGTFDGRDFVRAYCWPDALGAWGLAFTNVKVQRGETRLIPMRYEAPPTFSSTVAYVRMGLDGRRTSSVPTAQADMPGNAETFDWDGDGVSELVIPLDSAYMGPRRILTSRGGEVREYPVPVTPRLLKDVDGDGHMDLLYTAPFDGTVSMWEDHDVGTIDGPDSGGFWLVAHALPDGRFSLDDAVARAQSIKACRSADLTFERGENDVAESIATLSTVRCGRLRGRSTEDVETFIKRACRGKKKCLNEKLMHEWAKVTPPFVMKD